MGGVEGSRLLKRRPSGPPRNAALSESAATPGIVRKKICVMFNVSCRHWMKKDAKPRR